RFKMKNLNGEVRKIREKGKQRILLMQALSQKGKQRILLMQALSGNDVVEKGSTCLWRVVCGVPPQTSLTNFSNKLL
ncbi:MAG TPA: hypothetical protein VN516_03840, partial [Candidatus Baltobacteraceae bacterium]|nr:hypothetical protein [Candidatus Baltobacteraceae bacterium]